MNSKLALLLAPLALFACRTGFTDDATLASFNENVGTLYLVPSADSHLLDGVIQYRLYDNGSIRYSGDLTYNLHPGIGINLQVPFSGQYQVQPGTVRSASYKQPGASLVEGSVTLSTAATAGASATVNAAVTDSGNPESTDAAGTLQLDTSGNIVGIQAADITGTVFGGTPAAIKVHLKLANQPAPGGDVTDTQ